MLELHRGQGMEIHWRDTVACPTENDYLVMVKRSEFYSSEQGTPGGPNF